MWPVVTAFGLDELLVDAHRPVRPASMKHPNLFWPGVPGPRSWPDLGFVLGRGHDGVVHRLHYRFGALLAMIVFTLAFGLAAPDADWARLAAVSLQAATLIVAVIASRMHVWVIRLTAVASLADLPGERGGPDRRQRAAGRQAPQGHLSSEAQAARAWISSQKG